MAANRSWACATALACREAHSHCSRCPLEGDHLVLVERAGGGCGDDLAIVVITRTDWLPDRALDAGYAYRGPEGTTTVTRPSASTRATGQVSNSCSVAAIVRQTSPRHHDAGEALVDVEELVKPPALCVEQRVENGRAGVRKRRPVRKRHDRDREVISRAQHGWGEQRR